MKKLWNKILRWWYRQDFTKLAKRGLLTKEDVLTVLRSMNLSNPRNRERNIWDERFLDVIPFLHQYDEALDFLNRFGFVCDTYFDHLSVLNPSQNYELQKCFCSIEGLCLRDDLKGWIPKYRNLFFHFSEAYELLPELEEMLHSEKRYKGLLDIYEKFHPYP